uniref:CCHC-type domain-containing protein n=1 Tax=Tanacetum cinerariifolium TaxID=118510 RepID=A0A6L2N1Y5_TANCI|nr:hypothetical protein [Tanacetum cinerariifolium]
MQGTSLTKHESECKLYDEFDKFSYKKGETLRDFYLRFLLLLNDMNIYNVKLEQFQVNTKFLNTLPPEWSKFMTDVKLVRDLHTTNIDQLHAYLGQHEFNANEVRLMHERNSDPLALVATYQMTQQHATINDGRVTLQPVHGRKIYFATGTSRTYTLAASGSNSGKQMTIICYNCKGKWHMSKQCTKPKRQRDDSWFKDKVLVVQAQANGQILHEEELAFLADPGIPKVALMANLSHYGSDTLTEVHNPDNVDNRIINQGVQNHNRLLFRIQKHLHNKMLLLSVIEQLKSQVINCTKINLDNKSANYSLTVELERYKEQVKVLKEGQNVDLKSKDNVLDSCEQSKKESRNIDREIALEKKIKQLDNIVFKRDQSAQTVHMLMKPQFFYDHTTKQALGFQNPFYLKKAQKLKPKLYDDPSPSCRPTKVEVPKELPKVSMCLKLETALLKKRDFIEKETYDKLFRSFTILEKHCISLEVDTQLNQEIFQRNNSVSNQSALSFDQYFELNELKAQSQEKETVIKKLKEIIKSLSKNMNEDKIKKDIEDIETINIELDHRVSKLIVENEHLKQTYKQLYDSIKPTPLKEELRKLKGKSIIACRESVNKPKVIASVVHQVDLEPLSPKLKNNNEAHIDYIRITKENADTLCDIVEQARTLNPLDNALAYACMYTKHIQELLVYVSDTCPSSPLKSEKLVAVTPMNKARKVTFVKTSTISDNNTQI